MEFLKYDSWLKGNLHYNANSISLNNAFSKQKKEFPKYEEVFKIEKKKNNKKLTENEINIKVQNEFNAWARY